MLHELSNLVAICIHSVQRDRVSFFWGCVVIVDSLCLFSRAFVPSHTAGCLGIVNLENAALCCWASQATSQMLPPALPFVWGLGLFFSFGNSRLSWICSVFCGRKSLLKNSLMTLKWTIYFLSRLTQCSHLPPLLCFFTPVFPELQAFLEYISCNELCGHQKFSLKLYGINIC